MEQSEYLEILAEDTLSVFDSVSEVAGKQLSSTSSATSNDWQNP